MTIPCLHIWIDFAGARRFKTLVHDYFLIFRSVRCEDKYTSAFSYFNDATLVNMKRGRTTATTKARFTGAHPGPFGGLVGFMPNTKC